MFKQMKKKLNNKKGFTLAELLVVIAILAILIAIAIPVFSNMVADSNMRVNQANVRSVRSAGVAYVLTHLEEGNLRDGLGDGHGWVAIAKVDNNGDVQDLKVLPSGSISDYKNGISTEKLTGANNKKDSGGSWYVLSDKVTEPFATVKPITEDGGAKCYWVQAVIHDLND